MIRNLLDFLAAAFVSVARDDAPGLASRTDAALADAARVVAKLDALAVSAECVMDNIETEIADHEARITTLIRAHEDMLSEKARIERVRDKFADLLA